MKVGKGCFIVDIHHHLHFRSSIRHRFSTKYGVSIATYRFGT
jgi:hypothetical protein